MFEHLDDPDPPAFDSAQLDQIAARCAARRRRKGLVGVAAFGVFAAAVAGFAVTVADTERHSPHVAATTAEDRTTPAPPQDPRQPEIAAPELETSAGHTRNDSDDSPTTSASTIPSPSDEDGFVLLADRDTTLATDEWLLPLKAPAGYRESGGQVSTSTGRPPGHPPSSEAVDQYTTRTYSMTEANEQARIEITIRDAPFPIGGLTVNGITPEADQIDGVDWLIGTGPDLTETGFQHVAQRLVGTTPITVTARGAITEAEFRDTIASLAVVPRSILYSPIIDPTGADSREVFTEEAFGASVTYRLQSFNYDMATRQPGGQWECSYLLRSATTSSPGMSTRCGLPRTGLITGTLNHRAHQPPGQPRLEVTAYGITDPTVTRVEVAMFNGDTVTARTKPSTELENQRYWFFADTFDFDPALLATDGPLLLPPTIQSITAYDSNDTIIAVETPPTDTTGKIVAPEPQQDDPSAVAD